MQSKTQPHILVLGATGITGRITFLYLSSQFVNVWGTTRNKKKDNFYLLNVDSYRKDFNSVLKKIKKIDYMINCIGVLKDSVPVSQIIQVNSLFPHMLSGLSNIFGFKLIHISSDAVFSSLSGKVNEKSQTTPEGLYGASKLLGEVESKNVINIRTSPLGFDPYEHKGLLEHAIASKSLVGFTNQKWSGCTTLQFAQLCSNIISNRFSELRKNSHIFHFSPIIETTKYDILEVFLAITKTQKFLKKDKSNKINRSIVSLYQKQLGLKNYKSNIKQALTELILFEKNNGYEV